MTEGNFVVRMKNNVRFSRCECPSEPITNVVNELIIVQREGNILTVTGSFERRSRELRIYAILSMEAQGVVIFTILDHLPDHVADQAFFPAAGTLAMFAADPAGARRLRATGMDRNSGQCRGWIFEAVEG